MSDLKKVVLNKEELAVLADKYLNDKATEAEAKLLHAWYEQVADEELIVVISRTKLSLGKLEAEMLSELKRRIAADRRKKTLRTYWWRAAAVFILLLGTGITYRWLNNTSKPKAEMVVTPVDDIAPGKDGAILTLPGNKTIVLDEIANGAVATESAVKIVKEGDAITYVFGTTAPNEQVEYHTVSTPRGRQFKIKLPDGTEAMLDAASSIYFPTAFTGGQRKIQVTGQVYLNVKRDVSKPFIVDNGVMEVEVLGTEFNICSYPEEQKRTVTLLHGSVKVSNRENNKTQVLLPGQQAMIGNSNDMLVLTDVDLEEVMAWKDGAFKFNGAKLSTVMNALSRWYDVDIVFKNTNADRLFSGYISRSLSLSKVLEILRLSEVNCKLEGNTLTLLP